MRLPNYPNSKVVGTVQHVPTKLIGEWIVLCMDDAIDHICANKGGFSASFRLAGHGSMLTSFFEELNRRARLEKKLKEMLRHG